MLHDELELRDDTRIIKHKRTSDFTIIYNACINDIHLSGDSLALLIYVMSKPDDWDIRISETSKRFSIGRDKTYNIINKLIEFGYMKRIRHRKKDGSLGTTSIYASDKPMFADEQLAPETQTMVEDNLTHKQPRPENQDVVAVETPNKQPHPEKPDMVNQDVVPYIQKKDDYKENNNNKILSNPIGDGSTPPSDKVDNIYPDASVVVFFMKKIEGSCVSESTLVGWLRKYGSDYVAEKIRIYQAKGAQTKGTLDNPGGYLSAAIAYDWKEKSSVQAANPVQKPCNLTDYPTLDENRKWFRQLSDTEKTGLRQLALVKQSSFDEMLKHAKTSVLDEEFPDSFLFKMLMEFVGRSKV